MNIIIVIRNLPARARLREQIEALSRDLEGYFGSIQRVEWDLAAKDRAVVAHCRVHVRRGFHRAQARATGARAALDQVFEKIVKQGRRRKRQKLTGRRRSPA